MLLVPVSAAPDVTITEATGGDNISADDFATGAWTTLVGPVIAETEAAEIGTGTIIFKVPDGFEFNPGQDVAAAVTGEATQLVLASNTATPAATTITFTVNSVSDNTSTITFSDIQVCPTRGKPLATGDIVMDAASTSTIAGVTHGTTSFGTLNEVLGAASQLVYTVAPSSVTAGTETTVFTVQRQDQFTNPITSGNTTVGLASTSDGVAKEFRATPGGAAVTEVTIADASSTADFYYYDEKVGKWTITASAASLTSAATDLLVCVVCVGVGGEAYLINKLAILAPWLGLVLILVIGASVFIRRWQRAC